MEYDYERSRISKATGLTGVEAGHIARMLKEMNIDPLAVDWEGAISDARDYSDRYNAVKTYLANYYGISLQSDYEIGQEQFSYDQLEMQAMDKPGVKGLLREYYKKGVNKRRKEQIKEMLLSDAPLHNVLMISLYDGADLPNARKFLNEAMQDQVLDVPEEAPFTPKPPGIPTDLIVYQHPGKISDPRKKPRIRFQFDKRIPGNGRIRPPLLEDPIITLTSDQYKINGNGKQKPGSKVDLDQLLYELQKEKQKQTISPNGNNGKPSAAEKKLMDLIKAGFKKEGQKWKKAMKGDKPSDPVAALRADIMRIQQQNLPLQLKIQREQLLMKQEQMQQLQQFFKHKQRRSSIMQAFSMIGLSPGSPPPGVLFRPGYFIESRPKLPAGFRYKKIPKGSKRTVAAAAQDPNLQICRRCGVHKVMMPNMFGQIRFVCPICGAT